MKAKILPLDDKYYGTEIEIVDDNGFEYLIKLWNSGNLEPSDRELGSECTIEQWRNNELLPFNDHGTGENGIRAKEYIEICDNHFESRTTYQFALKLVELINKGS